MELKFDMNDAADAHFGQFIDIVRKWLVPTKNIDVIIFNQCRRSIGGKMRAN